MPRPVLLNNIEHRDLCIDTRRSAALGDAVMFAPTFPSEFRNVQAHYPIVFAKTPDGTSFQAVALFGLREGENRFLANAGWDALHVPMLIERQPFLIGMAEGEPVVHVDMDSPRVGTVGEAVFQAHGGTTDYLERVSSLLLAIHDGLQAAPAFVAALLAHELLEPFVLDVEGDDGAQHRLAGFYTIHEERLAALDAGALDALHRAGHLQSIYLVVASMSQFGSLIKRRGSAGVDG